MKHKPHIILINPWITDFSAYNFWIRPLGLLVIASLLREHGFRVTLVDCLDFLDKKTQYGDGRFRKTRIEKPVPLKSIPRNYSRYGMPVEMLLKRLSFVEKPDLIAVTSGMTYWYPGVFEAIQIARKFFRRVPIILGGIYASICYEHAKEHSGADRVYKGEDEREIIGLIAKMIGFEPLTSDSLLRTGNLPYPAFDLYEKLDYVCISTTRGCPFSCTYCLTPVLSREYDRRDPISVVDEIENWTTRYAVRNIAFYDDALLIQPSEHIVPILKEVIERGIECDFHTPNALHIREINDEVASLLLRSGFKTIRLGLETSNEAIQTETGGKVNNEQFQHAMKSLRKAGYSKNDIGVYILAGLPGQKVEEVRETIAFVRETGGRPVLVEYSPIPQTPLFERAKQMSCFNLEEPLFHNNSLLPCQWEGFTAEDFRRVKEDLKGRQAKL